MPAHTEIQPETRADLKSPINLELQAVPSTLETAGGKAIRLTRAVLAIKNTGSETVRDLFPRATLSQEGGPSHEISEAMAGAGTEGGLEPGGTLHWDLFNLLAAGHPGVASKIHLFGYKAVLNWWFELAVRAEYRLRKGDSLLQTPRYRVRFRWNAQPGALDEVGLSIEPLKSASSAAAGYQPG